MLKELLKHKGGIGVTTLILFGIAALAWYIDVEINKRVSPMFQKITVQMTAGFNGMNSRLNGMEQSIIKIDLNQQELRNKEQATTDYQQKTLRVEVKDNAQSKVGKTEFWKTALEMY